MSETENTEGGQSTSSEEAADATTLSREALKAVASGEKLEAEPKEKEEAAGEEAGEENKEGSDEGEESGESEDEGSKEDEISSLKTLVTELQGRTEKQSKLLDKFGTEVGLLRKQTPEDAKAKLAEINDLYLENPVEGHKAMEAYFKEEKAAESQSREEEINGIIEGNRSTVVESIPDFEENIDANVSDIAEILEADGASDETIKAFKENPYVIDGSTLFALHKRNQVVNKLIETEDLLAERDAEIAELKKKPGEVLDKIANATNQNTLTGKGGSSSSAGAEKGGEAKVTQLSRAELKKIANGG